MSKYIFPKDNDIDEIDQTMYYWFQNGFNENEIKNIEKIAENIECKESTIFSGINKDIRKSNIKWIDFNDNTKWLYDKIFNYAKISNKQFGFKLFYAQDSIQYSIYKVNDKYDWHIDIGQNINSLRKLSCSILLNDPKDFEGGDLEFMTSNIPYKVPLKKGSIVFFPSFLLHRVSKILKGERKSLVLWIGGDHYQ